MRTLLVVVAIALLSSVAHAQDAVAERCNAVIAHDQIVQLVAAQARLEDAMKQANMAAYQDERTARAFRLAAYTAGFTIGAVGGGLTSSEMTTKPGLVAAGTAIGAVIGTAFVLIVDQVFLEN
jgi:uncharacterized membrane protein YoaK (UPF0700 family)